MKSSIEQIVKQFKIKGEVFDIIHNNTGNINKTYIVYVNNDSQIKKYILQTINTNVFKEPYLLMQNIKNVTKYCRNYLKSNNEDYKRGALNVIRTINDENLLKTKDNEYYRMYDFVENTKSYDKTEDKKTFYNVGKAFGRFVRMLDGYPINELIETIPNFHNTKIRYMDFINSVNNDLYNRVKNVTEEINFIHERKKYMGIIVDLIENKQIPVRVTHNDTKINNILMDSVTNEAVCVIDLDTVMPGSALYDFGDAIRAGAAKTYEDDTNLNNVGINVEYFTSFTDGYLKETKDILTKTETEHLALSCIILTLELAMRFLTDYINGDTYFKCDYENHNLDRARNQIALVKNMEKNYIQMDNIVKNIAGSTKCKSMKIKSNLNY